MHAALVLTQSGKCVVHCPVGAYAQRPLLRLDTLCTLLATMQALGPGASSYAELHGVGVIIVEGHAESTRDHVRLRVFTLSCSHIIPSQVPAVGRGAV
jgi:hypothetical protein